VSGDSVFCLGYFGFMNASKGVATLLAAVSQLANQNREFRLVLIGDALGGADPTNNETRAAVEQEIRRLGLEDRIDRTGQLSLDDVSIALQRCDALVFPFDDGASFRRSSLTAALVHARPVVTTLQPSGGNGIPGFESGESVLLVPPRDSSAMAVALAQIMDDPELRARLSQGAAQASAMLHWPRIASAVCNVYAAALDGAPR
jgi:glycosyltransferase involved in cell wall biosynthesis